MKNLLSQSNNKAKTPATLSLFRLIRYADSNYVSDYADRKLVIKNVLFVYKAIVFWYSKK